MRAFAATGWSPVVELRQYALRPGTRDDLIALFDSTFVESQEATGIELIGQFCDLDDQDRFVWLRGFRDMERRARSLAEFYDGPVWREHREAANATILESDDVLLLRPARPGSAFSLPPGREPRVDGDAPRADLVHAIVMELETASAEPAVVSFFEHAIAPTARRRTLRPRLLRVGAEREHLPAVAGACRRIGVRVVCRPRR